LNKFVNNRNGSLVSGVRRGGLLDGVEGLLGGVVDRGFVDGVVSVVDEGGGVEGVVRGDEGKGGDGDGVDLVCVVGWLVEWDVIVY
jgi:hypothetical protein